MGFIVGRKVGSQGKMMFMKNTQFQQKLTTLNGVSEPSSC
jgi:hypothetical protein